MHFASDNTGPVHPKILEALARANTGYAPAYGHDPLTAAVSDQLREIFEAPDAAIHLATDDGRSSAREPSVPGPATFSSSAYGGSATRARCRTRIR